MDLMQQTENAIQTFYNQPNTPQQQSAHEWLLSLQKSSEGWQISWMLLHTQKPVEVQYYGAIILHYKLSHSCKDVEASHLDELKARFPQLLSGFSRGPKLVLSKLCHCYAALHIQTADDKFVLIQCLEDLENHFKSLGMESKFVIVELLTSFAVEYRTLNLASFQKIIGRTFMNCFISTLLSMSKFVLQPDNSDSVEISYQLDMLTCITHWIEFGVSLVDFIELLPILLSKLSNLDLTEKSCEVIVELVTAPSSSTCPATVMIALSQILTLKPLIDSAVAECNQTLVNSLCMIFTSIGENHCQLFIKVNETAKQLLVIELVKTILCFTAMEGKYPVDEICSEMTLNFWYTLQDDLYSVDISEISEYQKQFVSAYAMLVDVFYKKCQFPCDADYENYSDDEKEAFRCYRIDVQDTMLYVYTLLQEDCLRFFIEKLNMLFADTSSEWYQYEAVLHLLRGASESFDTGETSYIPQLIQMLAKLPRHPKVFDTLIFFLGSLSDWLNSHPEQIGNVLPFLLEGLTNAETATSCSFSLRDICHECAMLIDVNLIMEVLCVCYKEIQNSKTPNKMVVRLYEIGGYLISALPPPLMDSHLQILVTPLLQSFKDLVTCINVKLTSKKTLIHYLSCFHGLFRTLDPFEEQDIHPVIKVYGQLIAHFRLLKPWCNIEDVAVVVTQCIIKVIEVSQEKMTPYVDLTTEILADFFNVHPFGCILDASSTLIGMLCSEKECTQRLKNLYDMLITVCVNLIDGGDGHNYPDCLLGFMDLLTRVIKTVPEFLVSSQEQQKSVLKCALLILSYPEAPTIKAASNFLISYINFSPCFASVKDMVEFLGRDITVQLLTCIGGVAPRHTVDYFAEVMLALNKNFVTLLSCWLNELFDREDFPTVNASSTAKEQFRKGVLREKASKRRMRELVKDFSLVCRGLQGMAYAQ